MENVDNGICVVRKENLRWRIGAACNNEYEFAPGFFWIDKHSELRGPYRSYNTALAKGREYFALLALKRLRSIVFVDIPVGINKLVDENFWNLG